MTTFTSDDREEEYKKILTAAPNQPGYEDAVPIPFAGWVNASPPHIVDSGASVMDVGALELANELELSSKHAEDHGTIAVRTGKAVAMLRQQAKELDEAGHMIGVLREYISDLEKGLDSSINLNKAQAERNNEPVAWIAVGDNTSVFFDLDCALAIDDNPTPLYTHPVNPKYDPETGEPLIDGYPLFSGLPHPVKDKPHPKCDEACMYLCQMRELTDEEIYACFHQYFVLGEPKPTHYELEYEDLIEFARAILRKASEK